MRPGTWKGAAAPALTVSAVGHLGPHLPRPLVLEDHVSVPPVGTVPVAVLAPWPRAPRRHSPRVTPS